ncbi:hypothetical protein [Methylicorpusculum sp.]|uniref:hypothetical protein n=1 Tax=Methylicorpusculum sp. TaxID=2713644 RepID=UPI002725F6B3|nr:hypothetical protein [Methylicorpusculum sp.]MDO8844778.1 hypothetical protein [Methylicorpusculum sp.]
MSTIKTLSSITVVTLSLFFAKASLAGTENYAGSDCVWRSGGAVTYDINGAVSNFSNATANVLCHVPHTDYDGFLNDGEIDSGYYQAVDLNNGANISCRFRSTALLANGTVSTQLGSVGNTAGFGTQRQHINLGGVGEDSNSAYTIACSIPATQAGVGTSKIQGYRVSQ